MRIFSGDAVAVFDAQADSAADVIAEVRRLFGAKPIRYVIISHFHEDHAGDVGAYADLGASIVTTRDSAVVLTRLAHPGPASAQAEAPPLHFIFVEDDLLRLEGSGGRALIIYRLSDLPHVRSMLIAYDPRAHIIAEADLFAEFSPVDDNSVRFAHWLDDTSAPRVRGIAGSHHRLIQVASFQAHVTAFESER